MTAATGAPRGLDELRGRVDRIDDAIADLLAERLGVVAEIARAKRAAGGAGGLALRPGREAQVIRRLVAREPAGRFPKPTLVRLWRELFAATTRAQTPFAVWVHAPPDRPETWDLARDHFGSLTPLHRAESPGHALRRAGAGEACVAVLPLPGEADRWWALLLDAPKDAPRVVARLPFAAPPDLAEEAGGLVLARLPPEPPTGDDLTLLALETDGALGPASVRELPAPLGDARLLAGHRDQAAGTFRHLVEVAGRVEAGDPRVGRSLAQAGGRVLRAVAAGCYARPLAAAELA